MEVKLAKYRATVAASALLQETLALLEALGGGPRHMRCLALGSPTESAAALYQLVLLDELRKRCNVDCGEVSVYDPVFSEDDRHLLAQLGYSVTERTPAPHAPEATLYFMPHADLRLTEEVLSSCRPRWLLGNHIDTHADRIPRQRLYREHRLVALLKHAAERAHGARPDGGFVTVRSRRALKPSPVEYDYAGVYFLRVSVRQITGEGPWGNAFLDLAIHHIH